MEKLPHRYQSRWHRIPASAPEGAGRTPLTVLRAATRQFAIEGFAPDAEFGDHLLPAALFRQAGAFGEPGIETILDSRL